MEILKALIKELAESFIRSYRKLSINRKIREKYTEELNGLSTNGFYVRENYISKTSCDNLIKEIDRLIEENQANIWRDELDADNRIYFIDTISEKFKDIYDTQYFRDVLWAYTGNSNPKGMLLAGRIDAVEGNLGSGGGWHRDSPFYHQTKAIIYLSDVEEDNGPFQYVPSSHKKKSILKSYIGNVFKPGQYRFTEKDVERYCKETGGAILDMTAGAGTLVFADTKGIHRGKPIISGRRYALFCYYWHGEVPNHFSKFKQI